MCVGLHFYFVKENSENKKKYSAKHIVVMLAFLIDNICFAFDGYVFQRTVGISMGANCAPLGRLVFVLV